MKPSRYNIYTLIHKTLRKELCEMLVRLGQLDDTHTPQVNDCLTQLKYLLYLCRLHLEEENHFLHPVLQQYKGFQSLAVEDDHEKQQAWISELESRIENLQVLPSLRRQQPLYAFYLEFANFVAENLLHMHEEETGCAELLTSHLSDEQILAIEHQIVTSLTPMDSWTSLKMMLVSCTYSERARLLGNILPMTNQAQQDELKEIIDLELGEAEVDRLFKTQPETLA